MRAMTRAITISLVTSFLLAGCCPRAVREQYVDLHQALLASPGDDLQAILDSGEDLLLQKGRVYRVSKSLTYRREGQRIATEGASRISEYATLRIDNPDLARLINGNHLSDIILEEVILDGNRYELSILDKSIRPQPPLIFFGGDNAENQVIRKCVMLSTRQARLHTTLVA